MKSIFIAALAIAILSSSCGSTTSSDKPNPNEQFYLQNQSFAKSYFKTLTNQNVEGIDWAEVESQLPMDGNEDQIRDALFELFGEQALNKIVDVVLDEPFQSRYLEELKANGFAATITRIYIDDREEMLEYRISLKTDAVFVFAEMQYMRTSFSSSQSFQKLDRVIDMFLGLSDEGDPIDPEILDQCTEEFEEPLDIIKCITEAMDEG